MTKKGYLLVAAGAALWGIIGIFIRGLYDLGFNSLQVIAVRVISAALMLVGYAVIKDRNLLRVDWRDLHYFIGTGIFSIVFFNWCYFVTIRQSSMSIAVILLYTAPAFVVLLSRLCFREALTRSKLFSLLLTFLGSILVVQFVPNLKGSVTLIGFLTGIGSGFGYALYSIFSKVALQKYDSLTVTTYTFIFAGIAMIPATHLWNAPGLTWNINTAVYIVCLGLLPTVMAYLLYTKGLAYIESSKASIVATIEPVVATLVSVIWYKEVLTVWQLFGIGLVMFAVIIVQGKAEDRNRLKASGPVKE